ncbi:MAG: Hint domain-containing protein, partial [Rhodobacter sp.]|nr:Hint domain-containing protein [Rhodobacter sp.]
MPFLTGSYITYETSGTNLVQTPAAIISDGDFTHTSTAGGVDNNILENNEPHNSVTIGINVNSLWVGKVYHMGKEFHVFELVPAQGTITHLICSVDDAADFGGAGNTANYPNNVPISSFDTADHAHCFGPGTAIATPTGETAVEALKIGDLVTTASGKSVPVKWIGHQARDHLSLMAASAEPVRIAANALGNGLPRRDLVV